MPGGGGAFTSMCASDLVGGGLLDVGIMGDALVEKTWPLVEVQVPGTASLLTPGGPCAPTPFSGTPGCVACVSYTMLEMRSN